MPLGLLAKDSIQDLASLGKEVEGEEELETSSASSGKGSLKHQPGDGGTLSLNTPNDEADDGDLSEHKSVLVDEAQRTGLQDETKDSTGAIANPQQAQEEGEGTSGSKASRLEVGSSYGKYSGFQTASFENDQNYRDSQADFSHDTYAPLFLDQKAKRSGFLKCLLPCLFPWTQPGSVPATPSWADESYSAAVVGDARRSSPVPNNVLDEDEKSNSSDALGERLSDKERQAVLARLRLAQPDDAGSVSERNGVGGVGSAAGALGSPSENRKGLLNGIPNYDASSLEGIDRADDPLAQGTPLKGILKRRSTVSVPGAAADQRNKPAALGSPSSNKGSTPQRRSLFPTYEKASPHRSNNHVAFAPMARVVTVKSKNDMAPDEKGDIWWIRSDYEDFRKTGRIITRAMLEGGSEIWLASNESFRNTNQSRAALSKSALSKSSSEGKARNETPGTPSKESVDSIIVTGDKWWHRFGHSRRGLEHVVSIDEGRQRQMNVKSAIRSVLEEQAKQRMYHREDTEKLRMVALQHTSWARDLALAAGSSDADAVQSSFAEDRKSREFYLTKMARSNPSINNGRNVPEFMQPAMHGGAHGLVSSHRLDANTAAQIRFRRQLQKREHEDHKKHTAPPAVEDERVEPVHDPNPSDNTHNESLSQRAAGFSAEGNEKVNMAAVLSGMGAIPQEPRVVAA